MEPLHELAVLHNILAVVRHEQDVCSDQAAQSNDDEEKDESLIHGEGVHSHHNVHDDLKRSNQDDHVSQDLG